MKSLKFLKGKNREEPSVESQFEQSKAELKAMTLKQGAAKDKQIRSSSNPCR